jgi:hypothetical protein
LIFLERYFGRSTEEWEQTMLKESLLAAAMAFPAWHGDKESSEDRQERLTVIAQAIDSKGGFTIVLAGLKAWLEHGIALNLVADQFPDGHIDSDGWRGPGERLSV